MAEGLIGGVIGDEDESSEAESDALAGADAFAAAIAARLSANDPGVSRKTEEFLAEQTRLVAVQRAHLEEEHALRLSKLRGQRKGIHIRVAFQVFVALVASVIGIGFAVLLRDAVTSHNVIVEAFEAPPALAPRGVSGTVVAGALLDELTRLKDSTRTSMAAKRDLTSAWSHEVKVSVPDAGISLGEISTLLKARFGHDLHIGGDLVDAGEGRLALTVRGDGVRAKTFTGKSDELNQLIVAAVSNVLGVLASMGDEEGAWRAGEELKRLAGGPDLPAVYYSWGLALDKHGDLDGAVAKLLEANRCGPHWADPLKAWGDVLMKQAHIKEALAKYDEALKYAPTWERLKEARAAAAKRVPT